MKLFVKFRAPPTDWNVPENFKNQWLYQLAADTWAQWVPGSESTILRGGFYAFEVNPGLKIIALNNNFCYTSNWLELNTKKNYCLIVYMV